MGYKPSTEVTESLQCLSCAALQELNDLNEITLFNLMQNKRRGSTDYIDLQPQIYQNTIISDKAWKGLKTWATDPDSKIKLQEWITSSVEIAKSLKGDSKFKSTYKFYRQDQIPGKGTYKDFKKVFIQLLKNINEKAKNPEEKSFFQNSAKKVYNSISRMKEDKWNPADIIAVKQGRESFWENYIQNFISNQQKRQNKSTIQDDLSSFAKDLIKQQGSSKGKIEIILAMEDLYQYNKDITRGIETGDFIPISLKKSMSPSPGVQFIKVSEPADINEYFKMKVIQNDVIYKKGPSATIEFIVEMGDKTNWEFDIRSFAPRSEIKDVDVELKKPGAAAAQGKIALSVSSNIAQLSGARRAFALMTRMRKAFWAQETPKGQRSPTKGLFFKHTVSQNYKFTNYKIFDQMHQIHEKNMRNKHKFLKRANIGFDRKIEQQKVLGVRGARPKVVAIDEFDQDQIMNSIRAWAHYAEWLSNGEFTYDEFMTGALGRAQWAEVMKSEKKKGEPYEITVAQTQAKWMRGKIQSYEQAWLLDNQGTDNPIADTKVQENIHKSMWMYAASKGFTVFNKNNVVAYLLSGPYLKCAA